ncbi:unnamed protein product [Schistosoma turkestanicum]|nr:unnamed protein product [Schistosoma turkestanicum]
MSMMSSSIAYNQYDCGTQAQSTEVVSSQFQGFNPVNECRDTSYVLNSYPKELQKICCNMFTTPKFCEWLKHEWLYSSIDKEIFLRVNDFQLILREHFPTLKSRKLTRAHWSTIRRIIGRPRRFSATFLAEERHSVQVKRRNIQYIQHIILTSSLGPMASEHLDNLLLCLPPTIRIPLRLPVGIRVCVCLHTPMQGLYLGLIQNSCPGEGNYTVWIDELIISNDYMEMKSSNHYGCQIVPEEDVFPLPNQSLPPCLSLLEIRNCFKENILGSNDVTVYSSSEFNTTNSININNKMLLESSNHHHHHHHHDLHGIVQSLSSPTTTTTAVAAVAAAATSGPLLSENMYDDDNHDDRDDTDLPLQQMNNSQVSSADDLLIQPVKFNISNHHQHQHPHHPDHPAAVPVPVPAHVHVSPLLPPPSFITSPCSEQPCSQIMSTDYEAYNKFLIDIIKLCKILERKYSSIETLKQLNDTAELELSVNQNNITIQFQHTYAILILNIDKINQELKHYMNQVLSYVSTMAKEQNMMELNSIIDWRRRCDDEAQEIVNRMKDLQIYKLIDETKLDLVTKLISILLYLSNLSDHRYMNQIPACLDSIFNEIKHDIHPSNIKCFETTVESVIGQILNPVANSAAYNNNNNTRMYYKYHHPMMYNTQCQQDNLI